MNESLLQYIWRFSLYSSAGLQTLAGKPLHVLFPGFLNKDAGPDFSEAQIKIGDILWVGHIELHLRTSDWVKHRHHENEAYRQVVLHVVYEHDVYPEDYNKSIPVLVLRDYIAAGTLEKYQKLYQSLNPVPCSSYLPDCDNLIKQTQLRKMLAERWQSRVRDWQGLLEQSNRDWNTLFYRQLAANFGFKTNSVPFLQLAQSLAQNILAKNRESLLKIEALLFGQAGLLEDRFDEAYPLQLQKEYRFLSHKYRLQPVKSYLWKFLRLRPANFPTVRIAQFAQLIYQSQHLFSKIVEINDLAALRRLLDVKAGCYWDHHYHFQKESADKSPKYLGQGSVDIILINTILPFQFFYGSIQGSEARKEQALTLLEQIKPEKNAITNMWATHNWKAQHAADSQGLIHLYNHYCSKKRCMECSIGLSVLRK